MPGRGITLEVTSNPLTEHTDRYFENRDLIFVDPEGAEVLKGRDNIILYDYDRDNPYLQKDDIAILTECDRVPYYQSLIALAIGHPKPTKKVEKEEPKIEKKKKKVKKEDKPYIPPNPTARKKPDSKLWIITCANCGSDRECYKSDLHQVKRCRDCQAEFARQRAKENILKRRKRKVERVVSGDF